MIDWKDIAAVSGKSGLYKVVKPTRAGFVLETIEKDSKRFIAGPSTKVSVLQEISIYTSDEPVPLAEVMQKIKKSATPLKVTSKSESADLMDFLKSVVPDFDEDRVYTSDIKKLVSWFSIIEQHAPELLEEEKKEEEKEKAPSTKKDGEEAPKKKAPAKKAAAKPKAVKEEK
ncbi:MAG: DUF5606 domain-containing protein [Cyclobacteriaceae bacterium]